jgi:asparagine synthase (glutamine-hydrolysing)
MGAPQERPCFEAAADEFAHLFEQAMRKRLPKDEGFILPLSGGRDSRHILFALDALGVKPGKVVTTQYTPPATNDDIRIAQLIAAALDIEHIVLKRAPNWFDSAVTEVHLSNLSGAAHIWSLPLSAYLYGKTNTLYDGLAGSVLSGGFMADALRHRLCREGRFEELAEIFLLEGGREGFNKSVLKPEFQRRIGFEIAVQRLAKELMRHADAVNPLLSFVLWNRTRRGVSQIPLSILGHIPTIHCPYLDRDLYTFLTGLPPDYLLDNKLHDAVIARAYPQYARLPYEDKSKKASLSAADFAYFKRSAGALLRYLAKREPRSSQFVRKDYLYVKSAYDWLRPRPIKPWYIPGTVYCLELEALLDAV